MKGIIIPDFKTYFKVTVTKTVRAIGEGTDTHQLNRNDRNMLTQLGPFDFKVAKTIQWQKDRLFIE